VVTATAAWILAFASIADAGIQSPPAGERPVHYNRVVTRDDLAGRTLRELELMRAIALHHSRQPAPVAKGWLRYYLPTYLPGGWRDVRKGEAGGSILPSVERQNAAFIAAYEKSLPLPELARRLDEIVARHRYAGRPRRDEFRFEAFSSDGHLALLSNHAGAILVEVSTGKVTSRWRTGADAGVRDAARVTFFGQSGSTPPPDVLKQGDGPKVVALLTKNGRWHRQLSLSPDGRRLLAGPASAEDRRTGESVDVELDIVVVDLNSRKEMLRVHGEGECHRWLPDSKRLIVAEARVVTASDLDSGKQLWSVPQPTGASYYGAPDCLSLESAPDGKLLFLDSAVIDADTGRTLKTLPLGALPTLAAFAPDSERILVAGAAGGGDASTRTSPAIWDAKTGSKLRTLSVTNGELAQFDSALAWSPDGRSVLVIGKKGPLLFDAESGQPISAFAGHERWWDLDEKVEAWLLARRLGRQIPALRDNDFDVAF